METSLDHRRFLADPDAHRPFADGDVFARAGGHATVGALIDGLYERIEADAELRPLFGRDLSNERAAQVRFFTEWLGGGADPSAVDDHGRTPLDWLDRAAKSVDRERIRSMLRRRSDRLPR